MFPWEERVRLLSLVDILEPLPPEEVEQLNWRLPYFRLERGELCYGPEDAGERLFILHKGRVRIYKVVNGREITLAVVGPGTVFGEMSLTGQRLQGAYAQAMEPSELSMMGKGDLKRLILDYPEVGIRMVDLLSERLRLQESRLADIALKDVPARLAGLILQLAESEGVVTREGYKIPARYTHRQLAAMIGAERVAVTKAFAQLQKMGAVERNDRQIYVKDMEALRRAAGRS